MTLKILGTGSYLPKKIISNDQLSQTVDTSDQWIFDRTGISQRHVSSEYETCALMATEASEKALKASGLTALDIDLIIVASTTPDYTFPSIACQVQSSLNCRSVPAFDLQAVCAGFVYGISFASSLSRSYNYKNVLLIGVEKMSSIVDWSDRNTCILFGDGAGATILRQDDSRHQLIDSILYSDGSLKDILYTTGGTSSEAIQNKICMNGKEVFKHGIQKMTDVSLEILRKNNLSIDDIAYFVPHQANVRIIDAIAQKVGIDEKKVIKTVDKHANCSAASIPLALDHLINHIKPKKDELILTVGFGAGLAWGANIISC
jgi:3-oxoacyl-[acyl-carrier-protein] synthase-3